MKVDCAGEIRESASRKPLHVSHPDTVEQALYLLVHDSGVPVSEQAAHLGVGSSFLYNCSNLNLSDQFRYPLRHLLPHSQLCKNPVVLDFLDRAMGRVAVPMMHQLDLFRSAPALEQLPTETMALTKELGDFSGKLYRCLLDQRMTPVEAVGCRKELFDLIKKATALYQTLEFWKD